MKKNAYEETTIKATAKRLNHLQKNSLLADPESIKTFVATKKCSNGFKESLIEAYDMLMRSQNLTWNKPFYARYDKLPKIPTEEKINMLILKANTRTQTFRLTPNLKTLRKADNHTRRRLMLKHSRQRRNDDSARLGRIESAHIKGYGTSALLLSWQPANPPSNTAKGCKYSKDKKPDQEQPRSSEIQTSRQQVGYRANEYNK